MPINDRCELTRGRLAVSEYGAVETLEGGVHDWLGDLVEHVGRARLLVEYMI